MGEKVIIHIKGIDSSIETTLANVTSEIETLRKKYQPVFDFGKKAFQGMSPLDQAALASSPIPVVGDIVGLVADANTFITDPESRTVMNAGLSALGLIPFVPPMGGVITDIAAPAWNKNKVSVPVGINPTKSEIKELLREEDTLRAIQAEDTYVWPMSDALHSDIEKKFGLKEDFSTHGIMAKEDFD